LAADSAVFDEDNLVSSAGPVPVMTLAQQTGLTRLLSEKVQILAPRIKSGAADPAPKLATVVAGMCAGADCIDHVDVLRSGGMKTLFDEGIRTLYGRNIIAGVHLRPCPATGIGAPRTLGLLV
jgi:hypothetical protein